MTHIFPSLISADLLNLGATIKQLEPYAAGFHIDIMDNHFVPNLTWGTMFVTAFAHATDAPLWIHLMVDNPASWIETMAAPAGSIITIHLESCAHLDSTPRQALVSSLITRIQQKQWRASLTLNPRTPIAALYPYLPLIDHVLIMSVEPGRSGQSFLPETDARITELLHHCSTHNLSVTIGVDGGLTKEHCLRLKNLGVEHFAAAAAIFHTPDPLHALKELHDL